MSTPLAAFGPGILIVTRTDTTTPVAINVGFAQELTLDFAGTTKQLFGQKQYPLVAARGTIKATGKWKAATISGVAWNAAFYGNTFSTAAASNIQWNIDSTLTLTSTMTSTAGAQTGSSLTFDADLGVKFSTIGLPLIRCSSTGTTVAGTTVSSGFYAIGSTSPGFYYFNAADTAAGYAVKITYTSLVSATAGQSLIVTNALIGTTPTFQLDYYTSLSQPTAKPFVVRVYQCVASKMMLAAKLEDFIMPEFDFDFFANSNDQVINYVFPEIS